jgi:hypothetical protein
MPSTNSNREPLKTSPISTKTFANHTPALIICNQPFWIPLRAALLFSQLLNFFIEISQSHSDRPFPRGSNERLFQPELREAPFEHEHTKALPTFALIETHRVRKRSLDRLPGIRLGKYWRFRQEDITNWLHRQRA